MWSQVPRPCFVLAPMADVTDVAFRAMFARHGKPDVFWTEFVSADGLLSPGRSVLLTDLLFESDQRPIVAQLFTADPDTLYRAGLLVRNLGFDGIDINMGCPDRSVEKQGCGANLIQHPERAVALIQAAQKTGLPVSVKTRLGYREVAIQTWLATLLRTGIHALSVHLRTRSELSKVPARWDCMQEIVALRDALAPETRIIGNGDVVSLAEAENRVQETGCDGVMVGRGVFGNPWFFNRSIHTVSVEERISALIEHTRLFTEKLPRKHFAIMRKHYKAYVQGFAGARELRMALMQEDSAEGALCLAQSFLSEQISTDKY